MNPAGEQKGAAREFYRKKREGYAFSADMKTTMAHAHEEDELAVFIASREQQVAENAVRVIVEAVKNREPIAAYGLIEGDKRKAEVFLRLQHSQWEGDVANAASAAAPFLNPKGE